MIFSNIIPRLAARMAGSFVIACVLIIQNAWATIYFQDGFNYQNGSKLGTNAPWTPSFTSGITITNNTLATYSSGGFTLQDFSPPGLHVFSTSKASGYGLNYCTNMTPVSTGSGGAIYCSFIIDMTATISDDAYAFPILGLFGTSKTNYANANYGASNESFMLECMTNASVTKIGLQVANGTNLLGQTTSSLATNFTTLSLNTVHLVVIKYDLTTGMGYLFLDPTPGSSEPAVSTASATSVAPTNTPSFTGVNAQGRFWMQNNYGTSPYAYTPTFQLDTLRIGSTWTDVTPAVAVSYTPRNLTWRGDGSANAWNLGTAPNWVTNGGMTLTGFTNTDLVTFDDSATNFTVNISADVLPGSILVNSTNNYTLSSTGAGLIDGTTGLVKTNNGTLIIGSSNTLAGTIYVYGGVLQPANSNALGSTAILTVTNGGTLDINGSSWIGSNTYQGQLSRQIFLSGTGYNGLGAVMNSSTNPPTGLSGYSANSFSLNVTLNGNTTINAANGPFDIGDQYGGTLVGNGYNLTKTGTNIVSLICNGSTGLGNIEIQQGYLFFTGGGFENLYSNDMGNAANTLTVDANASLGLFEPMGTNGGNLSKLWVLNSPAEIYTGYANNTNLGSVTLNGIGTNTIYVDNSFTPSSLTLNGAVSGSGSLLLSGPNTLRLSGTNSYSGNTIIANGTMALGANGLITNTPLISLAAGATFDVSASATGFTFAGANPLQTLACSSTSGIATNIAGTGAKAVTLASGALASFQAAGGASTSAGSIQVSGDLNLNNNIIYVNVTGSTLTTSTNRLVSATGVVTGMANTIPVITGIALPGGTTAAISTTTGSAGHVDLIVTAGATGTPAFSGLSSKTITYGAGSVTLSGNLSASGPLYPATGETVTITINGNAQNTTINDSTGDFSISYNPSTISVGGSPYTIFYSYAGDSLLNATNDTSTTLTINKRTPIITSAPTASAITYGQTLAGSSLSGGSATTPGGFSFTTPSTAPGAGTASQGVTFTPTDTTDYNNASTSVNVTVNQAAPALSVGNSPVVYNGSPESASINSSVGGVVNNVLYNGSATVPSAAGTYAITASFSPTDNTDYSSLSGVSVGNFVIQMATTLFSGLISQTNSYGVTNLILTGTVSAAGPAYPSDGDIVSATINGYTVNGNVTNSTGNFVINYDDASLTTNGVSASPYTITYQYAGNGNLFSVTDTTTLLVITQATPTVAAPTTSALIYGQPLADSTLSGGTATNPANNAAVTGGFSFTMPNGVPYAGNTNVSVTFTPLDTNDYSIAMATVTVVVGQQTPLVELVPTATAIVYGEPLSDSSLSGGTVTNAAGETVVGSFAFSTPTIMPYAGITDVSVTFTPTDALDYSPATATVSVAVAQQTPLIETAPAATAIIYGQTLSDSSLSGGIVTNAAGGAVGGNFAFSTPTITPYAGITNVSVTFAPTDAVDYGPVSTVVSLTVGQQTPLIAAAPTTTAITYGQPLADSSLSGGTVTNAAGGMVGGSFAFSTPVITPYPGITNVPVMFTPTDAVDYGPATVVVNVTVNALPTLSVAPAALNSISLSWSSWATNGFILETTTNLNQAGGWSAVLTITNTASVILPASNQISFFRLYLP